jgi:hypothetical protein
MLLTISLDVGDEGSDGDDPYRIAYDLVRRIVREEYHAEVIGFEMESKSLPGSAVVGDVRVVGDVKV